MSAHQQPEQDLSVVAPGYPAIETLKKIDVSGWEPAAVFKPVVAQLVESEIASTGE